MATGFNTKVGKGEYRLKFETDDKEQFLLMQEIARRCVDGTIHIEKQAESEPSPCETCNRTKDAKTCANKNCTNWQGWFLRQWERIHNYGEKYKA